jgi:hypothetical protein
MRRREFMVLIGGVAATWPLSARAQRSAAPALPRIGLLFAFGTEPALNAIIGSLAERGFPNSPSSSRRGSSWLSISKRLTRSG